ncbi:MAG: T9SS type A sorting domain-containing protein [Flavipsychrobacter sp.]
MKKLVYTIMLLTMTTTVFAQMPTLLLDIDGNAPNLLSDKTGVHNVKNNNGVYADNGTIVFPTSSDKYLYIDSIGNKIDMNQNWIFECKLKVTDSTDEVAIIDFRSTSTTGNMYFNYNRYGQGLHFSDRAINGEKGALIADSTLLPQNVWVDLKLEFLNDTLRLYRNSVMVKDTVITATLSLSARTTIGYSEDRRTAHDTFYMDDIKFRAIDTTTLGIKSVVQRQVQIVPNPASDKIILTTNEKISRVDIYDVAGRLVTSAFVEQNKVNIAHIESGMYYLKAYGDKQQFYQARFYKQ